MCAGRTLEGAGCVTWWGFSPALDLRSTRPLRQQGEVNVLLIGSADPRHILKTIAGLRDSDTLHVWVIESCLEVVARQLLLLSLALISPAAMGLHEKTEVFLEAFGNSKVRSQTERTVRHLAHQLSLHVTDTLAAPVNPCLDTSQLKFKDRDDLERIFKQWIHPPCSSPCMSKVWDCRVRQHLGTRYDSRLGCFDWDLSMKLHQRGCGAINKQQYIRWREQGVAFELREGIYEATNHSLISTRIFNHRGDKVAVRGYWGDIVSSPYLSFGIETDNKDLLRTQNGQYTKTAQDISYYNVQKLFQSVSSRGQGVLSSEQMPQEETEQDAMTESPVSPFLPEASRDSGNRVLNGVNVTFLPVDSLSKLPEKEKYSFLFNIIYCSASMVHQVSPSLKQIAAPKAVLVVELANYLLDLSKEQLTGFPEKVNDIAQDAGFEASQEQKSDVFAMFELKENQKP